MRLTNLSDPILTFKGTPVQNGEEGNLTRKEALLTLLGVMKADKGSEAFRVYKIGTALCEADSELPINSEDLATLKHAVDQNGEATLRDRQGAPVQAYAAFIQGQLQQYLKDMDEADKPKKEEK